MELFCDSLNGLSTLNIEDHFIDQVTLPTHLVYVLTIDCFPEPYYVIPRVVILVTNNSNHDANKMNFKTYSISQYNVKQDWERNNLYGTLLSLT